MSTAWAEVLSIALLVQAQAPDGVLGVSVMNIPALAISSTDIRNRVREQRPIRYLVPEGVKSYVEKAGLYR